MMDWVRLRKARVQINKSQTNKPNVEEYIYFLILYEGVWRRDGGVANTRVRVSAEVALNYLSYIQRDQAEIFYMQAGFLGWLEG